MYRVCINKATGALIEMQSGGKIERLPKTDSVKDEEYSQYLADCVKIEAERLNTLRTNAINAGYTDADIEVKWVTEEQYAAVTAPTAEEIQVQTKERAIHAIQAILDAKAKEFGFDSIHTAAVWTISKNPARKARADALVAWGDKVWDAAEAEWANQEKGESTYSTIEEFIAGMPAFVPPAQ
ncbi:MAG: hypothetical protein ACYDHW_06925 [Syntrophorhabdaceae bacterium]